MKSMKLQFLTPALHGALDYIAAGALILLPVILGLQGLELWLSVAGGAGLILYSLLTDYRFGVVKLLSFDLHLLFDLAAGVVFLIAPFALGFSPVATIYYPVMALGVMAVVATTMRLAKG
jgi:hypothetical protein